MSDTANAGGAAGVRLYVDAIDEAMDKAIRVKRKPGEMPRRPKRQIIDIGLRQLKMAEKLQRSIKAEINERNSQGVAPDAQFLFAFNALTTSIVKTMEQVRRCRKAETDTLSKLDDDGIDEVLRAHLPRLARGMAPSDRRFMLEAWFGAEVADVLLKPREVVGAPTAVSAATATGDPTTVPL